MPQVNPDHLDQLAGLLEGVDGQSGVAADLQQLFIRAGQIDAEASDILSSLSSLQTWAVETAADLRGRAEIARSEGGSWFESARDVYDFVGNVRDWTNPALAALALRVSFKASPVIGRFPALVGGFGINMALVGADRASDAFGFTARFSAALGNQLRSPWIRALWGTPAQLTQNIGSLGQEAYASVRGGSNWLSSLSRYGGLLRWAGVGGGLLATGFGIADLVSQGNPVDAFNNDPSGYSVDVTSTLFSAAMTATLIAPNPVTAGIAVVAGVAYLGVLVWDNWDTITEWAGNAWDWTTDAWDANVLAGNIAWDVTSDLAGAGWDAMTDAASDGWDATTEAAGDATEEAVYSAIDAVDSAKEAANDFGDMLGF
jgi:hypothetical protein